MWLFKDKCVLLGPKLWTLTGTPHLLKSSVKFNWTPVCQFAFESIKALLTSSPVLAAPQLNRPFKPHVDACQVGDGALLLQENEQDIDCPVSFFSRMFASYQSRY